MAKQSLKSPLQTEQQRLCALCGELLDPELALVDIDRPNPKANGGEYQDGNMRLLHPTCHMKRHGIHRIRQEDLERLKSIIDDREQVRKLAQKVQNQMLAYARGTDELSDLTLEWLKAQSKEYAKALRDRDKLLSSWVKDASKTDPFIATVLGVPGVGPVTVAYCFAYLDMEGVFPETETDRAGKERPHPRAGQEKAPHASSLWAYCGLDKPSHSRYTKGTAGGGNKTLRTVLYTMAESQVKSRGAYREIYDRTKERLALSEKVTKSRNTQGNLVEVAWKDTKPSHRHGAALRAIMKHFLADFWFVYRTMHGMSTNPVYAEAILGKDGHRTIDPVSRGWKY